MSLSLLPNLLLIAWLLPLASFVLILFFGAIYVLVTIRLIYGIIRELSS